MQKIKKIFLGFFNVQKKNNKVKNIKYVRKYKNIKLISQGGGEVKWGVQKVRNARPKHARPRQLRS